MKGVNNPLSNEYIHKNKEQDHKTGPVRGGY
jgi:hypothetical protein